jgi:hypothetical protein
VIKDVSDKLREPFPSAAIGLRPVVVCPACKGVDVECDQHQPAVLCQDCGATAPEGHEHVEYIGHAWVRERFTDADPDWDWEPLAYDERGLPQFDKHGGLWIRLTIGGRTVLGYGDAPGAYGGNAVKEAIGDAFRNAGQNFGVALEMWKRKTRGTVSAAAPPVDEDPRRAKQLRDELLRHTHRKGKNLGHLVGRFQRWTGGQHEFRTAPAHVLQAYKEHLGIT